MQPLHDKLFDEETLPAMLEESDPAILLSFYQLFHEHTLSSWREAENYIADDNWSDVSIIAHTLTSSCRSIGADALSRVMADIEHLTKDGGSAGVEIALLNDLVCRTLARISDHMISLKAASSDE